jgi:hypothetical protein
LSLDTGRYQLYSTFKTLQERWEETKLHWYDSVRQDFEENHWGALEPRIRATLSAIDRLSQVMVRAKQECQ